MKDLIPAIFLVPIIALRIAILLFYYLLKKVSEKKIFKHLIINVILISFILNWIWELLQGPLYRGFTYTLPHLVVCTLASTADVTMVVLLYFIFAIFYKNPFWGKRLSFIRVIIMMIIGGIGTIVAESFHTSAGSWVYSDKMPIIPMVKVGLSPVLQFFILPVLIYYVSFRL